MASIAFRSPLSAALPQRLWAEAIVRYEAGAPWWLETSELEALATTEQALRFKIDPWRERAEEWIGDRNDVSVDEVVAALGQEPTQATWTRVARILTEMGFTKHRPRKGGVRENRYQREDI